MAIYMIDYENVKTGGLNGISRLTAEDRVIIFYSENANRITFDLHRRLMECPAKIEYREVTVGGHNALDFQLVTYLGYLIAQNPEGQYLIISYDRGFEYVVNFWRKDGLCIGLVPYLKDPSYALNKVIRGEPAGNCGSDKAPKQDETDEPVVEFVSTEEEAAEEPVQQVAEELPGEPVTPAEETPVLEAEEEIPPVEEEPVAVEASSQEAPAQEVPAEKADAEVPPVAEAPAPKKPAKKKPAPKKPAEKKDTPKTAAEEKPKKASEEKKPEEKKPEEKSTRSLPSVAELRSILGELVADDPEVRFVRTALEKYKTKLGLNNGLVKHFGNQRAGEIYQKVKPFVTQKKDR